MTQEELDAIRERCDANKSRGRMRKMGKATELLKALEQEVRAASDEAALAARSKVHADYAERLEDAHKAAAAEQAREAKDRARKNAGGSLNGKPVGTVFEEWKIDYRTAVPNRRPQFTGRVAVLEVYRSGDPLPGNLDPYFFPKDGSLILRILGKDGSRNKKVIRLSETDNKNIDWRVSDLKASQ